ncbi:hypothetical protein JYU34_020767 [Plutella xylostella]|uniref:Uncharacterized protein n=1 Tax=Plutella xylostella TaxID=51655 RepID=A0ABQ7PTH9_PLUXY|nr:hypothetical protein JYU34_020767 [Plutella xylostella]
MKRAQCLFSCNSFGDYQFEQASRGDCLPGDHYALLAREFLKLESHWSKVINFYWFFYWSKLKTLVSLFIFFLSLFNNGLDKIVPMGYQNQINKLPETSFGRTRSLGDMIN